MSTLTLAALCLLGMGFAVVLLTTWRNSRATGSMAQLLYRTEQLPRDRAVARAKDEKARRPS